MSKVINLLADEDRERFYQLRSQIRTGALPKTDPEYAALCKAYEAHRVKCVANRLWAAKTKHDRVLFNATTEERLLKLKRLAVKSALFRERNPGYASKTGFTYYYKNKERCVKRVVDRERVRLKEDVAFKLAKRIRTRLFCAIRDSAKKGSAVADLGCSVEELKHYLEARFLPGMTWENWSQHGWHIDHIKPLSAFDLTDRASLLQAVHFTNLQPLWAKDNLTKSDTWKEPPCV